MGGSRTQVNKAHKTRFASKASRDVHRTSRNDKGRIAKPDHRNAVKGARAARLQRNKMVLCGLSSSVNLNLFAKNLLMLLSGEETETISATIASPAYKLRTTVLVAPHGDLLACMEMVKVADLMVFVVSANSLYD